MSVFNDMMAAATVDRTAQRMHGERLMPVGSHPVYVPQSCWLATGIPNPGSLPSSGKANGRVCTRTTVGAFPIRTPPNGKKNFLRGVHYLNAAATGVGTLWVLDRLADVQLAHNEANGSITGCDASSKLGPATGWGDGGQICAFVSTGFSAASNTISLGYTSELGQAGSLASLATTASALVANPAFASVSPFLSLASGHRAVRSIDSVTLNAGSATGNYELSIVKVLATVPLHASGYMHEREFFYELPQAAPLRDDPCIFFVFCGQSVLSNTVPLIVDLHISPLS